MHDLLFQKSEILQKNLHAWYGRAFDQSVSRSFGNGFVWNVVSFGVDNSSLRHSENASNNFLVLGERPTDDISDRVDEPEKKV